MPHSAGVASWFDILFAEMLGELCRLRWCYGYLPDRGLGDGVRCPIEKGDTALIVEAGRVKDAIGNGRGINLCTYRPGLLVCVAVQVREGQAMRRHAGIDQGIEFERSGGFKFAADTRFDRAGQHIGNRGQADQGLAKGRLERSRRVKHLVAAVRRIISEFGESPPWTEEYRIMGDAVDAMQAHPGIDPPQSNSCHGRLGRPA